MSPAPVALEILRETAAWDEIPEADRTVDAAVTAAFEAAGLRARSDAELTVVLTDDAAVQDLNASWRGKDKPTNVLTFPAADPEATADAPLLGDVVLAYETVAAEAAAEGKRPADHLAHLVIHGVLHLFGHDHHEDRQAEMMEALEVAALAKLGIADPYREPRRVDATSEV